MWRRRLTLAAAAALTLMVATGPAHAGALAEVSHGLARAASDGGDGKHGSSGGSESSSSEHESGKSSSFWDSGCCHIDPSATLGYSYAVPPSGDSVQSELYFGAQSVANSDGAMTVEARATYDDFGLGVRDTSFFEQVDAKKNQYLRLDVWWLGGLWRFDHDEKSSIWLELGVSGLNGADQLSMTGVAAGLHFTRRAAGQLALTGGGRYFWFEHDVAAAEVYGGVQLSVLQITYRLLDFNVGPPLHGPEVGMLLVF
jgi:hypothetical protein